MPAADHMGVGFEELLDDRFLLGTPDEVAEQIVALRDRLGVNYFCVSVHLAGTPKQVALEQMHVLAEEVFPEADAGWADLPRPELLVRRLLERVGARRRECAVRQPRFALGREPRVAVGGTAKASGSVGFRLGLSLRCSTSRSRCSTTVRRQLVLRSPGWNCHLRRCVSSTARRLTSSRFSLRPMLSISSAMLSRSASFSRRVRSRSACSLAQP